MGKWTTEHTQVFLDLKMAMISEPVLEGPKWDGTPFIVTTDGCQDAFGVILMQRFEHILPSGKTMQHLHPLAFACQKQRRDTNLFY